MQVDPRREVNYTVFVEEVWPRIRKGVNFHPSLVWTEIMSFIKVGAGVSSLILICITHSRFYACIVLPDLITSYFVTILKQRSYSRKYEKLLNIVNHSC